MQTYLLFVFAVSGCSLVASYIQYVRLQMKIYGCNTKTRRCVYLGLLANKVC